MVQDPNGANISGVTVTAKNIATGATRTATTSDDGRWSLPGLTVGAYEVTYEMTGFKKLVRTGVEVEASVPRTLEDKLEIGEIGAVINVMEGASLIIGRNFHGCPTAFIRTFGTGADIDAQLHAIVVD